MERDLDSQRAVLQDQRLSIIGAVGQRRQHVHLIPGRRGSPADVHRKVTRPERILHEFAGLQGNPSFMNEISRVDMHVHSTASQLSKLGIQRSLHLPECATTPEQVYELARRRGMDFVTITDHDTIAGVLSIAHLPDTFISEELTVWFKGEAQAVHVLCYGITESDHEWLQTHSDDVEACAEYLHDRQIAAALAHPFYAVRAPLTARHRRRLAQLFPIWETRNGSRAKELNLPAFVYIETHGGTAIGGSDDHAGIDIGLTFTETPAVATPVQFLAHLRAGDADARGAQGSAAKWTHAAMALAIRSLGAGESSARPDPGQVLKIVERVMREGDVRHGGAGTDLGPQDTRALLRAWLQAMDLDVDEAGLLARLQEDELGHKDLYRRARRIHERQLAAAVRSAATITTGESPRLREHAVALFDACLPAIPYAAATAFLGREKAKLTRSDGERPRVALVADGLSAEHGVTNTIEQIRDRGVPGFEVEVIGTDAGVDRRLSAVAEIEVPFYQGLRIGVPSLPALVEALADGRYDLVHVCSPGPAGIGALLLARVLELPVLGSYHTELASYAGLRSGDPQLEALTSIALGAFYGACETVLAPSPASDERLARLGIAADRIGRWDRGVDLGRFAPTLKTRGLLSGELNVLYAGRLTSEKGIDLLADAFLAAHERDPRLRLVLAGGGPEATHLRDRLGELGTFLGWLDSERLARVYASADVFLFASRTDTFGQVILEAQASGLPVVAVDEGGPASLIAHGETGLLAPPDPDALADAVLSLVNAQLLRERLRRAALDAVGARTWEASLRRLATGYRRATARTAARSASRSVA
jgi:glycosyltransferase involved in cell wall biosynthesis/predicted metal-dependent phosphoesterase TrpH